ncbi:MAG: pirin family protein [bacterium]
MLEIRRREDMYHERRPWLDTDWHFSFGSYHDPERMGVGALRVLNNDRIAPEGGFPEHSHSDMEVITWVISGQLKHEDSTGGSSVMSRNEIQRMSAGTGISHSEYNPSDEDELHLIQIWIEPEEVGIDPEYEEASFDEEVLRDTLHPVASGIEESGVSIHQQARISVGHFSEREYYAHEMDCFHRGYMLVIDGEVECFDHRLSTGDALRVEEESQIEMANQADSEVMLIEVQ